jgi:nitroreductase
VAVGLIVICFSQVILQAVGTTSFYGENLECNAPSACCLNIALPPPDTIDDILEVTIHRRLSVREFTEEPISDEDLSTILWHAYGMIEGGKRTVHLLGDEPAVHLYVVREDGVFSYDVVNHSLILYKEGDYTGLVGWQYDAPLLLGLVWNTNTNSDENLSAAEIGEIGQNVYFVANALNLGTVTTGTFPSPMEAYVGLPSGERGRIVLYLGHPSYEYDFTDRPLWFSPLPRITDSSMSLTTAVEERREATSWQEGVTRQELSQLIWASYGYSNYLDNSEPEINFFNITRHRTVPSGCGLYSLRIYTVTESGISRYFPNIADTIYGEVQGVKSWPQITFLWKIRFGDRRADVAAASESFVVSAPLALIAVLDYEQLEKMDRPLHRYFIPWGMYYEAGASIHNVLLEATAWGLSGNVAPITDKAALCSLLRLDPERFDPMFVIPVGK